MKDGESLIVRQWAATLQAVTNPPLDGKNPHRGSRFATLQATLHVCREACAANGLGLSTPVSCMEINPIMIRADVVIYNEHGETLVVGQFPCPAGGTGPQDFGIARTYAVRYALYSTFGIFGEDDEDGESPKKKEEPKKTTKKAPAKKAAWSEGYGIETAMKVANSLSEAGITVGQIRKVVEKEFGKQPSSLTEWSTSTRDVILEHLEAVGVRDWESEILQEAYAAWNKELVKRDFSERPVGAKYCRTPEELVEKLLGPDREFKTEKGLGEALRNGEIIIPEGDTIPF